MNNYFCREFISFHRELNNNFYNFTFEIDEQRWADKSSIIDLFRQHDGLY